MLQGLKFKADKTDGTNKRENKHTIKASRLSIAMFLTDWITLTMAVMFVPPEQLVKISWCI